MAKRSKTAVVTFSGLILFLMGAYGKAVFPIVQRWIASLNPDVFGIICSVLGYIVLTRFIRWLRQKT